MLKLHRSADKQFYFTVCGKNSQPILTSETYKRKENAYIGIISAAIALQTEADRKDSYVTVKDCTSENKKEWISYKLQLKIRKRKK